jgi:hypothetical protein
MPNTCVLKETKLPQTLPAETLARPWDVSPPPGKKPIVVVLGMHRSGTSLLTSLLTELGVDLGEKLLGADISNQAGYWEQDEICKVQDALLQKSGWRWTSATGATPLPAGWWKLPLVQPFKQQLLTIVRTEIGQAKGVWGFKDPRTSRLLPLWQEIFAELRLEPIYLLAVRNPAAVVESIVKRDQIPVARAELLWLLHNLDAVRDAGPRLRLVVDYDRWFTQPLQQARAVVRALGLDETEAGNRIADRIIQHIRPDLRHCQTSREITWPWVKEAYDILKRAALAGRFPAELRRLEKNVNQVFSLCQAWGGACPPAGLHFSLIEHFAEGHTKALGPSAQAVIWDVHFDGAPEQTLLLHPPVEVAFDLPVSQPGVFSAEVCLHPEVWNRPQAGACEFQVQVDRRIALATVLDPVRLPGDRRWFNLQLEIPASPHGNHQISLRTRSAGGGSAFRWALWRNPRFSWTPPANPRLEDL